MPTHSPISNDTAPAAPTGSWKGLTKREQFAMTAMHGLLIALSEPMYRLNKQDTNGELVALQAVEHADALLAALDKS